MADLPEDLITEILTRLPVRSLLGFRSVSKRFQTLIDGPEFIKSHLNHSLLAKTNHKLILHHGRIYSADLSTLDETLQLNHPLHSNDPASEVLGSVNGILCLYDGHSDTVIWNLATRKYQIVPQEEIEYPDLGCYSRYMVYGFGYDLFSDDYKLLRMVYFLGDGCDVVESKVYSLRSNTWQRIQDFNYFLRHQYKKRRTSLYYRQYTRGYSVQVGGALHWIGASKHDIDGPDVIVAFDLATNKYRLVDQPMFPKKAFRVTVGELQGRLCLMGKEENERMRIDVWLMKDYGIRDSWSKLFSISEPVGIHFFEFNSFEFVTPLAYSEMGDKIMMVYNNEKLYWYFVREQSLKRIDLRGCPECFEPMICMESLVHLGEKAIDDTKKQVGKGPKRKQVQHRKKKRVQVEALGDGTNK